jgi:Rhodopirellula transposase DDE domain
LALVEPDERGDPAPLRWTTKSLRHLAEELTRQGTRSPPRRWPTVAAGGFSLRANLKPLEGAHHPDRDAQFRSLNEQVKDHQADGEPVISVDPNKREQPGRLPMAGPEWRPPASPSRSKTTTASSPVRTPGQAIGYGIYDLTRNTGWVSVGVDHDTSIFAVDADPPLVAGTRTPGLPERHRAC